MTGLIDPREPSVLPSQSPDRPLARSRDEIRPLLQLCREGRLYEVERWIADGKPLQLAPDAIRMGYRPPSALEIALKTGQHSLTLLLLKGGCRIDLERHSALDIALRHRRIDLLDLLLEWGADMRTASPYAVLETYDIALYERFRGAGYDLTQGHEMAGILGYGTSNRPLFGFVKRHRLEEPKIQTELNMALGYQVRRSNLRGIALCLWAGADPHAPAPNPELGIREDPDDVPEEDRFIGFSAINEAVRMGNLDILKKLRPDPKLDDFDDLYEAAKTTEMIRFLATIHPPKNLTSIIQWHARWMVDRYLSLNSGRYGIEALLKCGIRWEEPEPDKLTYIRSSLLKARDEDLKAIVVLLKQQEICSPDTYLELIHTPSMRKRLVALKLLKPFIRERKKNRTLVVRTTSMVRYEPVSTPLPSRILVPPTDTRFDRETLYEQVWSQPVQQVAKSYGISGRGLGKACRRLSVPVPPRGYWARVRNGYKEKRPPLPKARDS